MNTRLITVTLLSIQLIKKQPRYASYFIFTNKYSKGKEAKTRQTRLEVEERAGKASAGVAPVESDRGRQRQVGDGGGYTDSRPSALASCDECEVHPVGKDGWIPRVGGKLE